MWAGFVLFYFFCSLRFDCFRNRLHRMNSNASSVDIIMGVRLENACAAHFEVHTTLMNCDTCGKETTFLLVFRRKVYIFIKIDSVADPNFCGYFGFNTMASDGKRKANEPINLSHPYTTNTERTKMMAHHKFIATNSLDWIRRDVCQSK